MRKIPTVFQRDPDNLVAMVTSGRPAMVPSRSVASIGQGNRLNE
jgi:hypothetical protein